MRSNNCVTRCITQFNLVEHGGRQVYQLPAQLALCLHLAFDLGFALRFFG
jgi:hypothetical protein